MIFFLYVVISLFAVSKGTDEEATLFNSAGCVVDGITDALFLLGYDNSAIRDDYEGIVASFPTTDVYGVEVSGSKYFNATLESNTLTIFTTDEFKNIEPEIGYVALPSIRFMLSFQCPSGNLNLQFTQRLTDINNHDPYFEKENYEFIYVEDLPTFYELTNDQELSAIDIDMTNNGITFVLESNDFLSIREASTNSNTRKTFAALTSLRTIEAPRTIKLNLTATDVRDPTRSATTVVEVNVLLRSDGEVPRATFSNDTYTFTYQNGELVLDQEIRLTNGSGYLANITQIGYEDYFKVTFANRAEGILKVDVLQPLSRLSETEGSNIKFEIQLTNDGSSEPATAAVSINIPRDGNEIISCSDLTLSKRAYVGTYVDDGLLDFDDEILVNSDDTSNLTVTQSDWNNYFKPILVNNRIQITVIEPLPDTVLVNNTFIMFDIIVTKNYSSTGAAILIQLTSTSANERKFSFNRNSYVVFYNKNQSLTFQEEIILVGDVNNVTMRMENGNYTKYFYFESPAPGQITMGLRKQLQESDFRNGIIQFDLVALSTNSSHSATASVVVVRNSPRTFLILFFNSFSSYLHIFIVSVIFVAIVAGVGYKAKSKKRRSTPSSPLPSTSPPPYTATDSVKQK